jgi:hypothetical protein
LNRSPSPSAAAATILKHEPPVLAEFVKLVESGSQDINQFVSLYTPDATVESPMYGVKPVREFYTAFLPTLQGMKFVNKHKLIDPTQPNTAAVYFTGQGEVSGKPVQIQSIDLLELTEDGTKIKKLTLFSEGPKAKL